MAMKRHSCGDVTTTSRVNESRHYGCNFIFTIDKNPKDKLTWVDEMIIEIKSKIFKFGFTGLEHIYECRLKIGQKAKELMSWIGKEIH